MNKAISKIIFWQRFSAVVLFLFAVILSGVMLFIFREVVTQTDFRGNSLPIPTELIVFMVLAVGFAVGGALLGVALIQSASKLKSYNTQGDVKALEKSYALQHRFWIGGTIIVGSLLALVLFAALA